MASFPRWAKWASGCFLVLLAVPLALVLWVQWLFQPTVAARWRSPDGRWSVWLERPTGSMEPMYYTLHAHRGFFLFATECEVGGITAWRAEDYVRVTWPAPDRLVIRYGLSRYDRKRAGVPYLNPPTTGCGTLRAATGHDPSLDAAATRGNEGNSHFDNPPGPDIFGNSHV